MLPIVGMSDSVLYYRPIKLDQNSFIYGPEWHRLALPEAKLPQSHKAAVSEPRNGAPKLVLPPRGDHEKRRDQSASSSSFPIARAPSIESVVRHPESRPQPTLPAQPRITDSNNQLARSSDSSASKPTFDSGTPLTILSRADVAPANRHLRVRQLQDESRATPPGSERTRINRAIREIKAKTYQSAHATNDFCDVDGNPIGMVRVAHNGAVPPGSVAIARTDLVSSISFDFVEERSNTVATRKDRGNLAEEIGLALRFSAILSKEGTEALERLAKQIIKHSPYTYGIRLSNAREGVPNSEIKRILRQRNAFDTTIDDTPVHISTKGKVELHTTMPPIRLVTANQLQFKASLARHQKFTEFSRPPKRWVLRTSNELNEFVRNGFERLAGALNRIFA